LSTSNTPWEGILLRGMCNGVADSDIDIVLDRCVRDNVYVKIAYPGGVLDLGWLTCTNNKITIPKGSGLCSLIARYCSVRFYSESIESGSPSCGDGYCTVDAVSQTAVDVVLAVASFSGVSPLRTLGVKVGSLESTKNVTYMDMASALLGGGLAGANESFTLEWTSKVSPDASKYYRLQVDVPPCLVLDLGWGDGSRVELTSILWLFCIYVPVVDAWWLSINMGIDTPS